MMTTAMKAPARRAKAGKPADRADGATALQDPQAIT
jgi:hypothetical protein